MPHIGHLAARVNEFVRADVINKSVYIIHLHGNCGIYVEFGITYAPTW
jgi:hypothetical protein